MRKTFATPPPCAALCELRATTVATAAHATLFSRQSASASKPPAFQFGTALAT